MNVFEGLSGHAHGCQLGDSLASTCEAGAHAEVWLQPQKPSLV